VLDQVCHALSLARIGDGGIESGARDAGGLAATLIRRFEVGERNPIARPSASKCSVCNFPGRSARVRGRCPFLLDAGDDVAGVEVGTTKR